MHSSIHFNIQHMLHTYAHDYGHRVTAHDQIAQRELFEVREPPDSRVGCDAVAVSSSSSERQQWWAKKQ